MQRFVCYLFALVMAPLSAQGQALDTLYEYGNAAQANATSGAVIPRGADFSDSANGNYSITAGGTDFWSPTDHGSAMFGSENAPVTGNFSAVVKVQIGLEGEVMPGEWGRSGIMARTDPADPQSTYFASTQKFDGGKQHILQARDVKGAGTGRPSNGMPTTLVTGPAAAAAGMDPVPVWLGLHRYDGTIASTWAPDENGSPGEWSSAESRAGSDAHNGPVQLGLFHQNHNVQPETSTALFSGFSVRDFDNSLGEFPLQITRSHSLRSNADGKLTGDFYGVELGGSEKVPVHWKIELLGAPVTVPGLFARSFLRGNNGSMFNPGDETVNGSGQVDNIAWWGNANPPPVGFEKYPDVFNLPADTDSPADNQENYSVDLQGQIYIPASGTYKFKDGVDDYTFLAIDGETLVSDNAWTSPDGSANGGSPIVEKTFDSEGWYDFHMQTAEGGGGDAGVLYWDYDNDDFPTNIGDAAGTGAIVPAENFRTLTFAVDDEIFGFSVQEGVLVGDDGKMVSWAPGRLMRATVNGVPLTVQLAASGPCDTNRDGAIDSTDIDTLFLAIREGSLAHDLNRDGSVDLEDVGFYLNGFCRSTWFGDSNLDGEFNSGDLVAVFEAGQYEDDIDKNSTWATGDWDGDQEFTSSDMVVAFTDGGYELGPRPAVNAVPEPTSLVLLLVGLITVHTCRRHK